MRKSLIYKMIVFLLLIIVLILEVLPYGAVLNFATNNGENLIRSTYSYFSLTPFGYANFGPFLTAITTVLLLILMVMFIIKHNSAILKIINYLSILAFLLSLSPLLYGLNFFSIVGLLISLLLLIEIFILLIFKEKIFLENKLLWN